LTLRFFCRYSYKVEYEFIRALFVQSTLSTPSTVANHNLQLMVSNMSVKVLELIRLVFGKRQSNKFIVIQIYSL
jgi:hypothetical protein